MSPQAPADADALRSAFSAAQAQAERHFGDGPPPPWAPRSGTTRHWHRAGAAGLLVAAALAAWQFGVRPADATARAAPAPVPIAAAAPAVTADVEPPVPAALPAPDAVLAVSRSGGLWRVEAQGASRLEAAHRLAALSGSALHGPHDLLARATPLSLRWQGRTLAEAWERVLGPDLSYALQCQRDRCQAWVVAAAPTGAPPAQPPADRAAAPDAPTAASDADDPRNSRITPPTGDGGASHH